MRTIYGNCPLGSTCEEIKTINEEKVRVICPWYDHVIGKDPNTGAELDEWRCSINWLKTLLIENSQMQRQTAKAVESFRNKMVEANDALLAVAEKKLIEH